MPMNASPRMFRCPGETYDISREVHLARLAVYYPACRDCPHNIDRGQLPLAPFPDAEERRIEREVLVSGGIRGVYCNVIDRSRAGRWGRAIAAALWAEHVGNLEASADSRPMVVFGHDDAVHSPEIAAGLAEGLRQAGVSIRDLGLTSKPLLNAALRQFPSTAAVFVTSAGEGVAWTGFDLLNGYGAPWSPQRELPALQALFEADERTAWSRSAGTYEPIEATFDDIDLATCFHALRPLHVVVSCEGLMMRQRLSLSFQPLPCRLTQIDLPLRKRDLATPEGAYLEVLGGTIRETGADVGFFLAADGERLAALDERGTFLPLAAVTRLIAGELLRDEPGGCIILAESLLPNLASQIISFGGRTLTAPDDSAELSRALVRENALLATGSMPLWWLSSQGLATCDSLRVVAAILRRLSRSDAACSELIL